MLVDNNRTAVECIADAKYLRGSF